jgi:hypothetical protein
MTSRRSSGAYKSIGLLRYGFRMSGFISSPHRHSGPSVQPGSSNRSIEDMTQLTEDAADRLRCAGSNLREGDFICNGC